MNRFVHALLAVVALACAVQSAAAAQPGTMRVDYFHTGGRGAEVFALDRVAIEPLPWPGNMSHTIDDGLAGTYRFEVRDKNGAVLYARGFSSIYAEWVTTAEAGTSSRTFHESLRFPAPVEAVQVALFKRDPQQAFQPVWQATVDPTDMFVDRAAPPPQQLLEIERHGESADKADLLLLGDGYTAAECATKFKLDALRMTAALFRHQPFASRRSDFNVWGLCPPSSESGISRPSTGIQHRTPVGATYDARAYYRPQLDCVMFTRDEVAFCHVCQDALERVIDLYAGARPARH